MPDEKSPLSEQDYVELTQKLRDLDDAERMIDRGIRGGVDLSAQKAQAQELRVKITKLRQSFFPGR